MEKHPSASLQSGQTAQKEAPTARIGLDIETECAAPGCDGKGCEHALRPWTARITIIGVYCFQLPPMRAIIRQTFRSVGDLNAFLDNIPRFVLIGHNLKWDLKVLNANGFRHSDKWGGDSLLAAAVSLTKIPPDYLRRYEAERQKRNKQLPRGVSHRMAGAGSLKTLAPYFLKVPPFWEDPTNHDNEEYVLKDTEYALRLEEFLSQRLREEGLEDFYRKRLLRWTKMLLRAEERGVTLNMPLLHTKEATAKSNAARLRHELDMEWAPAYCTYREKEIKGLIADSFVRCSAFINKLKDKSDEKVFKTQARYGAACDKKIKAVPALMNLDSPTQLTWILRDHFGLDIKDYDDDDSTGKAVLQKLAAGGRRDVETFLTYRQQQKLSTAFFPSYREFLAPDGAIHTSFNSTGTRTGRLSSSGPNLQQVPSDLHELFIARAGRKLITRDMSAIEPCVVAYYTEDPLLCNTVISGASFHAQNVRIMMGLAGTDAEIKRLYPKEYKLAKQCGLALMYGAGPGRIQVTAQQVGFMWPDEKCQDIYENFLDAYKEVFAFKRELDQVLWQGNSVPNLLGRRHSYPHKRDIQMKGFNTLVQSTASDLLLESTCRAWEEMQSHDVDAYPLLWVHDETIFEAAEDHVEHAEEIIERSVTCHTLSTRFGAIPLKCEGKTANYWSK